MGTSEYSKTQVRKASKALVANNISLEDESKYRKILANFRSSHSYPMHSMVVSFSKKAIQVDEDAIVVRRLKRSPSIVNKLKRIKTMQVTTMGDIGGVRIILGDIQKVYQLRDDLLKVRTKNKLLFKKDYLKEPKESGYRSIHLTYSYQGSKESFKDFRIELQLRSEIQHSWATAVEVVGTFTTENLKASQGHPEWLEFFKLVSKAFASLEDKQPIDKDFKKRIKEKIVNLRVYDVMIQCVIVIRYAGKKEGYYLLELNIKERKLISTFYKYNLLDKAKEKYSIIEQEISEDNTRDVVLVAAKSLNKLKKAYPNYFADTKLFLKNINKVIDDSILP